MNVEIELRANGDCLGECRAYKMHETTIRFQKLISSKLDEFVARKARLSH